MNVPDPNDGRFLEGHSVPGQLLDAGIPNITGKASRNGSDSRYQLWGDGATCSGCFYAQTSGWQNGTADTGIGRHSPYDLSIDASSSSPVFGKSDTVQPKAYTVKHIIFVGI